MDEDKTKVKLIEINKMNDDFKEIDKYTNFISITLKRLLNQENIYKEEIKKCIQVSDSINQYVNGMIDNRDITQTRLVLFDIFRDYEKYSTRKDDNKTMKKNLYTRK